MPIENDANIAALKASGDADTQLIALITLKDGTKYHISTRELLIATPEEAEVTYYPFLRQRVTTRASLRKITDTVDISIQNVDQVIGKTVLATQYALNGSSCIIWKVYIDLNDNKYVKEKVRGVLSQARAIGSNEVSVKLIPDTNYRRRGRGSRTMQESCDFAYKVDPRCGSPDPSETCDYTYAGANGCIHKLPALVLINPVPANNGPSYGGLIGAQSQTTVNTTGPTDEPDGPTIDGGRRFPTGDDGYGGGYGRYGPRELLPIIPL